MEVWLFNKYILSIKLCDEQLSIGAEAKDEREWMADGPPSSPKPPESSLHDEMWLREPKLITVTLYRNDCFRVRGIPPF
jgi:hypothetical protein